MRACVRACARACVCACVREYVCVCVCVRVCVYGAVSVSVYLWMSMCWGGRGGASPIVLLYNPPVSSHAAGLKE